MPKFCPDTFKPKESDIQWAIDEFQIDRKEVMRQLGILRDREFRRDYSDWNRVFRNWFRQAEKFEDFRRTSHRQPEVYTEEQRKIDREKAVAQMAAYRK